MKGAPSTAATADPREVKTGHFAAQKGHSYYIYIYVSFYTRPELANSAFKGQTKNACFSDQFCVVKE
jgi:hypothetical protein